MEKHLKNKMNRNMYGKLFAINILIFGIYDNN